MRSKVTPEPRGREVSLPSLPSQGKRPVAASKSSLACLAPSSAIASAGGRRRPRPADPAPLRREHRAVYAALLETFRSDRFEEVSLAHWLALTPHELVEATVGIGEDILSRVPPEKTPIVPP